MTIDRSPMLNLVRTLCRPRWFVALMAAPSIGVALAYLQTIEYAKARQNLVGVLSTGNTQNIPDYSDLVLTRLDVFVVIGLSACLFGPFLVPFLVERWADPVLKARRRTLKEWFQKYVVPSVIVTLAMTAVLQFAFGKTNVEFVTWSAGGVFLIALIWAVAALLNRWKAGAIEAVGRMAVATLAGTTVVGCVLLTTWFRLPTLRFGIAVGMWKDLSAIAVIYILVVSIGTWVAISFSSQKKPRPPSGSFLGVLLAALLFLVLLSVLAIDAELEWINRGFDYNVRSIYGEISQSTIGALWRLHDQHVMARSVITLLFGVVFVVAGGSVIKILAFTAWAGSTRRLPAQRKRERREADV